MGMEGSKTVVRQLTITPSPVNLDDINLTPSALQAISSHGPQKANDASTGWVYENRRQIQQVLSFLYLGPTSALRGGQFIKDNGITMILAVRNSNSPGAGFNIVDRLAEELGLAKANVAVASQWELARAFPVATAKVNEHLAQTGRKGKVLVVCETGNERSAAVVAAYIMTVYGTDLVTAVQFVGLKRFCAMFDEDSKIALQVYGDILQARRDVKGVVSVPAQEDRVDSGKRRADELSTDDDEEMVVDEERYIERGFVPFVERR